ncbi:Ppx/GppA phosphatase family protein [Asticcacaulis sp. AC466]|uniref:Ppx/GppA phosphatase family protein n=1 Tax=Asticcacaulis sp. AC466 TaxID=1282362 RepID=UPI001F29F454|nr:Ppx/GppA phosphatase family protein [Asticcacaulis sp. AC466]
MYRAPSKDRRRMAPAGQGRAAGDAAVRGGDSHTLYAALDLGTNNCRLMIATLHNSQFRIVEAFSRIVRLGEGLAHSGRLHERAMERALKALKICAEKIEKRGAARIRAVATQACRIALNGQDFIARVEHETGLRLTIITPEEEAHLSVVGCASLLDGREVTPQARAALVMDVGGGSTELSWVELADDVTASPKVSLTDAQTSVQNNALRMARRLPKPRYWISLPIGVVNLAERFPEPSNGDTRQWFENMVEEVSRSLRDFDAPESLRGHFDCGEAYIVGTSGAITSLAGMHLRLDRYDRSKVDGLWMSHDNVQTVIERLLALGPSGRELEPCIGKDRADLVLAGAAILEAVQRLWPCQRLRVADRGLREGLLLSMAKKKTRRRRRRTHTRTPQAIA